MAVELVDSSRGGGGNIFDCGVYDSISKTAY